MKIRFLFFIGSFLFVSQVISQNTVEIPAFQSATFTYTDYDLSKVYLKNKSKKGVEVKVLDKEMILRQNILRYAMT